MSLEPPAFGQARIVHQQDQIYFVLLGQGCQTCSIMSSHDVSQLFPFFPQLNAGWAWPVHDASDPLAASSTPLFQADEQPSKSNAIFVFCYGWLWQRLVRYKVGKHLRSNPHSSSGRQLFKVVRQIAIDNCFEHPNLHCAN